MNEIVIDTSIVVHHFRKNGLLTAKLDSYDELYLPQAALGELYAGAYRSANPDKNLHQIEVFLQSVAVLTSDQTTAIYYGRLSAKLSKAGNLIPQNDLWIAAIAMQCNLPLATLDRHFENVPGLIVELW